MSSTPDLVFHQTRSGVEAGGEARSPGGPGMGEGHKQVLKLPPERRQYSHPLSLPTQSPFRNQAGRAKWGGRLRPQKQAPSHPALQPPGHSEPHHRDRLPFPVDQGGSCPESGRRLEGIQAGAFRPGPHSSYECPWSHFLRVLPGRYRLPIWADGGVQPREGIKGAHVYSGASWGGVQPFTQ